MGNTNRISVVRKNSCPLVFGVETLDGIAFDLSHVSTASFTVKKNISDEDSAALILKNWTVYSDAVQGITDHTLTPNETDIPEGIYYWDFKLETSAGEVFSSSRGLFIITEAINK